MIEFREVTTDNFKAVIQLQLKDDQIGFLENNLYSLAEAKVDSKLVPNAIYRDGVLIGFILYYFVQHEPNYIYLKRLMIDQAYQGKGYGRETMQAAIEYFGKEYKIGCVELMHYPENTGGAALYESFGFVPTGEIRETEIVRRKYLI